MKKRLEFNAIISLATVAGLAWGLTGCTKKITTEKDKISYTIGVQFAKNLKQQNVDIDSKALARAVDDVMSGKKPVLDQKQMQEAMQNLNKNRQQQMEEEAKTNKKKADDFLAENKKKDGIKTTASGLQYKITKEGTGVAPKPDDTVVVNYKGTLTDGKVFDSSYERKQPAEFPLKGVIPGWTEGLQLMKKGGTATFYIPPELAYGSHARPGIPPNSVLVFDVELLDVKPAPKAATGHHKKAAKTHKK